MSNLRNKLIRLAHEHPEFRKDILPLLKTASMIDPQAMKIANDPSGMSDKALKQYPKTMFALKKIGEQVGEVRVSMVNLGWNPTSVSLPKDIQKSIDLLKDLVSQLQYSYTKEVS